MPLIKRGSAPVAETPTVAPAIQPAVQSTDTSIPAGLNDVTLHAAGSKPVVTAKAALSYSDAKDRRISRQGLYQAALQSQGLMQYAPNLEDYYALIRRTAEEGLKFVNEGA